MYIWLALKSHFLFALNNTSTTKNEIQKIPCCVILGGPLLWEPSSQFSEYRYAKMNCKNKACSYQGIRLTWEAHCCCRRVCKLSEFRMSFLIKTREGGKKHKNTKKDTQPNMKTTSKRCQTFRKLKIVQYLGLFF